MTRTPVEDRLTDRLTRLADYAATTPTTQPAVDLVAAPPTRRSRTPILTVAAVVVAIVAVGGVVLANRPDSDPSAGTPRASFERGATPPDVALPGWATTRSEKSSIPGPPEGSRLFLVLEDPARGFDGPRVKVGVIALPGGFSSGPQAQSVMINGTIAQLGVAPHTIYLSWSPAPDRVVYLEGTRATTDQVLAVARGLQLAPDLTSATATVVPPGLSVTPLDPPPAVTTNYAEYRFERGDALLQVNLYAGGRSAFEGRLHDPVRNATARDTVGALNDAVGAPGHYRLHIVDGRWAVEVTGGPFPDEAAFLAAVDALQVSG